MLEGRTDGAPQSGAIMLSSGAVTLLLNGYYVAQQAPTTLYLECEYGGNDAGQFSSDMVADQYGHANSDSGKVMPARVDSEG
jgi:hypothetical protein